MLKKIKFVLIRKQKLILSLFASVSILVLGIIAFYQLSNQDKKEAGAAIETSNLSNLLVNCDSVKQSTTTPTTTCRFRWSDTGALFDNPADLKLFIQNGSDTPTASAGGNCTGGNSTTNFIVTCTNVPMSGNTNEGYSRIWARVGTGSYVDTGEKVYIEPLDYNYYKGNIEILPNRGNLAPNYKLVDSSGNITLALKNVETVVKRTLSGNYTCKFDWGLVGTDSSTNTGWTTISGASSVIYNTTNQSCGPVTFSSSDKPNNTLNFTFRVTLTGGLSETYIFTSDYSYKINGVVS